MFFYIGRKNKIEGDDKNKKKHMFHIYSLSTKFRYRLKNNHIYIYNQLKLYNLLYNKRSFRSRIHYQSPKLL